MTALAKLGTPAILKTRRFGYDGKGQAKVATARRRSGRFRSFKDAPSILEGFVDFAFEASVIAARGRDGSFAAYDPPENYHAITSCAARPFRHGLTRGADATKRKAIATQDRRRARLCRRAGVELFVRKDGALLVNEIAPRVHNSGHWTLEACVISQFEQHIRAVAGWPLGDPARATPTP